MIRILLIILSVIFSGIAVTDNDISQIKKIVETKAPVVETTVKPETTKSPTKKPEATKEETPKPEVTKSPTKKPEATRAVTKKPEATKTPTKKPAATKKPVSESTKTPQKAKEYDPYKIVKLVAEKCEANGMITTERNLDNLLREGKITKEEYDEYYPLDGLEGSYFSVFMETDLNKASTTSGRLLKSEEGIVDYISALLLLEKDPVFNITYAGTYKTNSEVFYEFRCHR